MKVLRSSYRYMQHGLKDNENLNGKVPHLNEELLQMHLQSKEWLFVH